ncbi:UDP-glycosyltransferase 89B2-like [Chenopodium quinoa]|uniref:UDP-glycosyltransferase 89B2-like n=1 Tax=Chenopodium quinoa TaxID=63459 RepID=UPI000B77AC66|nr:UDP-glycosyltransferase 89B2-like [Chenopodium quinoa]
MAPEIETGTDIDTETTHILVIPYPAQGHMIPLLDLTHHLLSTRRLTITVVTTPMNLPLLSPLLTLFPSNITPLVLPFPWAPGIPAGKENTKDLPPASFRQIIPALAKLRDPLSHWFESHPSPPVAIISDMFLGWTHRFAVELGVKRVVFSPSGGMALSVIYSLWKGMPQGGDQNGDVLFEDVPNCPKYPWWQLSPVYRSYVEGDPDSELIKEGFWDDMASWGLVVNSFDGLERVYLDHLRGSMGYDDRVWDVGPLVPGKGYKDRGGASSIEVDKMLAWLDTCRDNEVVYVSFGTQAILTSQQIEVIAEGLERSGVRFIWPIRDHVTTRQMEGDRETVMNGFEDRMAGRGIVIRGWAPQVVILRHRAVGTFLTHCGWNSILEGIMASVRLLAWPFGADQFSNATLLVDYLKVGVRVCEGSNMVPNPCDLARILADLAYQDEASRQKIIKLQSNALEALSETGSSSKALSRFVNELCELKTSRPKSHIISHNNHVE